MTTVQIPKLQDRAAWWEAHKYEWLLRQGSTFVDRFNKEHYDRVKAARINLTNEKRDKSDVDIYENDIVRSRGDTWLVLFGDCDHGYVGWYAQDKVGHRWPVSNDAKRDNNCSIEVIGNIHQHPELLNPKEI